MLTVHDGQITSKPNSRSTGDETWNSGSVRARLKKYFRMLTVTVTRSKLPVIDGRTHTFMANPDSFTNQDCIQQFSIILLFVTGTPEISETVLVHRVCFKFRSSSYNTVMTLISDEQSTRARITYHEPERSRTWINPVALYLFYIIIYISPNNTGDMDWAPVDNVETEVDQRRWWGWRNWSCGISCCDEWI